MKANSADNPFTKGYFGSQESLTLFQCSKCQKVLGDSNSLMKIRRPHSEPATRENSYLLFSSLLNVLAFSDNISYEEDGFFKHCTYKLIFCKICNKALGRLYIATNAKAGQFLNSYCILEAAIRPTSIGKAKLIDAATLRTQFLREMSKESPKLQVSPPKKKSVFPVASPLPPPPQLSQMMNSQGEEESKAKGAPSKQSPRFGKQPIDEEKLKELLDLQRNMKEMHKCLLYLDNGLDETEKELTRHKA